MKRVTTMATPVAHLVGPGKIKVVNGYLAFSAKDKSPQRLDPKALHTLICYGPVGVTDDAFTVLFQNDVQVSWMTPAGQRCRGRLLRADPSTTMIRLLQYHAFVDTAFCQQWANTMVAAKIDSQMQAVRHYQRHGNAHAKTLLLQLQQSHSQCDGSLTLPELRGLEGATSAAWFGLLGGLLQLPWYFHGRNRRPPRDPVNALLSLGYTWLTNRIVARCEAVGLEVYLGGLHRYRAGRPSLACDLIEPLRLPAVDRWVLKICNQNLLQPDDFVQEENGGFRLQPDVFGRILISWEEYWFDNEHDSLLQKWIDFLLKQLRQRNTLLSQLIADDEQSDL